MDSTVLLGAPRLGHSQLLGKPYFRRYRGQRARQRAPVAQVDPLLSLWQQPVVHRAAMKAVGIAIASFTAAGTLSALLGKVARKVRSHPCTPCQVFGMLCVSPCRWRSADMMPLDSEIIKSHVCRNLGPCSLSTMVRLRRPNLCRCRCSKRLLSLYRCCLLPR